MEATSAVGLVDRLTALHLRLLTLWDDPPAWFADRALRPVQPGAMGSRMQTAEAGLPELTGRRDFIATLAFDLKNAGLMTGELGGMITSSGMMSRLSSDLGRQLAHFVSPPAG
jgi:hypothetical protein